MEARADHARARAPPRLAAPGVPVPVTTAFGSMAALLAAGLFAEQVARRTRVPDIVFFLLAGVLLGPVLGWVRISASGGLAGFILTFGAAFMLYEGGRRLTLPVLREIWLGLTLLSTVGVLVTATVTTLAARWAFGLPWAESGLLAAVVASTDPATIIPLFREIRIRPRLSRLLEGESAGNDAVSAVLTVVLLAVVTGGRVTVAGTAVQFVWEVVGGAAVGLGGAVLAAWLLPGGRGLGWLDRREQATVLSLTVVLATFFLAERLQASGYMAAFAAGLATANRGLLRVRPPSEHLRLHDAFFDQLSMLVRMVIFLMLGVVLGLHDVTRTLWAELAFGAALVLVARPLAVLACLPADLIARWTRGEVAFACWVRETGVVPAALAGILLHRGVPDAPRIAAAVFGVVALTILAQVPTTRWWARRTGVATGGR